MKLALTVLFVVAIWLIQCLVGGTRLVYSLPSYSILAAAGLLSMGSMRWPVAKPSLICLGTTFVFFAYILARAAVSPVAYLWWQDYFMVLACLIAYLLTAFYISSSRLRLIVVIGLLALALVEILVGLRQFRGGDEWMPFGFVRSSYGSRASGMFISSIHLAGYLEAVGVLALSIAVWSKWSLWARIAVGYIALLCYAGVAITGSRGGYLSCIFSLLVFAAISLWIQRTTNPRRFARSALIAGVGFVGFFGIAFLSMQGSSLLRARLGAIIQKDVRFYNWQAAFDQFKTAPVFGTGAGTHLYFGRLFRRPQIQYDPEHAHSDYLEMLAEYGLVGLCGIAIFIFVHCDSCRLAVAAHAADSLRHPDEPLSDNRLALQIGALSAIAAYLAHSVTDFNLHIPGNALLFAFIFGIAANPDGRTHSTSGQATGARFFQFALPALSLWMLIQGMPKLPGDYWCERARKAAHFRDYSAAIDFARRGLQAEQRIPDLYKILASAYSARAATEKVPALRRELLNTSITAAQQAARLFPADEQAQMQIARICDEAGRFREAGDAYKISILLDPNLGSIRAYYGRHLARVGRVVEAQEQVRKAQELGSLRNPGSLIRDTILSLPQAD